MSWRDDITWSPSLSRVVAATALALVLGCGGAQTAWTPPVGPALAHASAIVVRAANGAERAAALSDEEIATHLALATALLDEGANEAALAHLEILRIARPYWWTFRYLYARALYLGRNDLSGARANAEACLQIDANAAPCHELLGMLHADAGDLEAAEASLRRALEIAPESTQALDLLSRLYVRLRRYEEARALVARLLERAPDDLSLNLQMASIDERMGNLDGAEARFRWVAEHHRDPLAGLSYLMRFYQRIDRPDRADAIRTQIEQLGRSQQRTGRAMRPL